MVQILRPIGAQTPPAGSTVVQADSLAQPAAQIVAPAMEFVDIQLPPAPVAATSSSVFVGSVGGTAVLLVGLAVVLWSRGKGADEAPTPVAAVADAKAVMDDPIVPDPYAVSSVSEAADERPKPNELPVEPVAKTPADDLPAPELPALPADGHNLLHNVAEPETSNAEPPQQAAAEATRERRLPSVLRFDPLDFDPTRLSRGDASVAPPSAGSINADPAHEVELEQEAPLRDAEADVVLPAPVGQETLRVRLGPLPGEARRPGNEARLALRVDSLELSEVPLVQFVDVVSDMAGVPVTLDPMVLELAGVSPSTAVSVQGKHATLEKLLSEALSRHRLALAERGGQVTVALEGGDRWRAVAYEVKDLARGADAKGIAELIERFVAPATWRRPGTRQDRVPGASSGKGTIAVDGTELRVEQTHEFQHEILVFCERLRLARGLASRSRYTAERLSIETPWDAIESKLNKRTTFTFLPWTRLADVLRYWEDASGLAILVDWSALAEVELGPSSPISCSAIDRTWLESLDGILEPLGLAWRPVDGETIQITSRDALHEIWRVEFYAVPQSLRAQFAGDEALVASLHAEVRERTDGAQHASKAMNWELDGPSGRLIVLAPPAVHRHLRQRLREGVAE